MTKLSKIYEQKNGNFLEIKVDYDENCNMIANVEARSYNAKIRQYTNLTEIFSTVPQLADLVDDTDWDEEARQYQLSKEEEVCDEY